MSSYFFNGRLYTSPATMSRIDDSAMLSTNLGVGNSAAYIGSATGGQPNTDLSFSSAEEARAVLRSGPLLDAIAKAFSPSNDTGGPSTVHAIRVNPAVQAKRSLLSSGGTAAVDLVSTDYGLWTNQIKVKVEAGSSAGLNITTQFQDGYYNGDNIARDAFEIQYLGDAATGTMTVNATSIVLQAPSGTTVATVDLNAYSTYSQVVDYINTVTGWSASLAESSGEDLIALNGLDFVTSVDVKTSAYTATANLQAVVDWFNSNAEGYVTASRAASAGTAPAPTAFVYLSGGSDGVVSNAEWNKAFATMQGVDAQWVCPISTNPAIWALTDAHVQFMSGQGRQERRAIVGTPTGTSDAEAISFAKALNSDRTSLVHIGYYDYNSAGKLQLFSPAYTAALLTGMFAGVNPGTALTNKTISVSGLERNLRNPTDTDVLIQGGVLCVESTKAGYKVVQSNSSWLKDSKFNRVEQSCGVATDYTARTVREALDVLRGEKNNQITLGRAFSITQTALAALAVPEPSGPGVLAGNAANPPFKNITVTANGDVLAVSFQCSPVIPVNYIPVSISLQIFTGTASA